MPPASRSLPGRLVRLAALAGALSLAVDLAAIRLTPAAPPYLLLAYVDEVFREILSPTAVAKAPSLKRRPSSSSVPFPDTATPIPRPSRRRMP